MSLNEITHKHQPQELCTNFWESREREKRALFSTMIARVRYDDASWCHFNTKIIFEFIVHLTCYRKVKMILSKNKRIEIFDRSNGEKNIFDHHIWSHIAVCTISAIEITQYNLNVLTLAHDGMPLKC